MAIETRLESNVAIPPGLTIRDELAARGMSQRQLADDMERPASAVNAIVLGKKAITPRTALDLEKALEIPAHVWLRLEADYRLALERGHPVIDFRDLGPVASEAAPPLRAGR